MTTIEDNKIIHRLKKGGENRDITIRGVDWEMFDEIKVQIKSINKIEAPPVLDLSADVVIDGESLTIPITGQTTLKFNSHKMFFDIKPILDEKVSFVIQGEIITEQTVTQPWS